MKRISVGSSTRRTHRKPWEQKDEEKSCDRAGLGGGESKRENPKPPASAAPVDGGREMGPGDGVVTEPSNFNLQQYTGIESSSVAVYAKESGEGGKDWEAHTSSSPWLSLTAQIHMVGSTRPKSANNAVRRTAGRRVAASSGRSIAISKSEGALLLDDRQRHAASQHGSSKKNGAAAAKVRRGGGRASRKRVLNWYHLPTKGGWAPSARAGHTAVINGTEMVVFGGIVNGERVNELACFDLDTRAWCRLFPASPGVGVQGRTQSNANANVALAKATSPAPRAYHVSWGYDESLYIHGGEGPMVGSRTGSINPDMCDVYGGVGRDPFAEEDGGAPLESGRVMVAAAENNCAADRGSRTPKRGEDEVGSAAEPTGHEEGKEPPPRRPVVSVLDDLWKVDLRTLVWERLSSRLAPLGRKGHTASVVPIGGQPCVLLFGGAPAGRRGLSNALYSASLALLSVGEGTWERHRPTGSAPAPRQGHTLTAVAGGRRLVLFGGLGERGELFGDIHILEVNGGSLAWASVQTPVGDTPTARQGHSACEVPTAAGFAAGVTQGGGVLVFGGEGRVTEGEEILSTNSHEALLYDPKESRWRVVETGHAFPIGRHGHSMSSIAGWTPPSFHPDGRLTAVELAQQSKPGLPSDISNAQHAAKERERGIAANGPAAAVAVRTVRGGEGEVVNSRGDTKRAVARKLPSEAAVFQWGEKAPTCAVVFGGLNSMYVNPEVWLLPLRWVENTVQFFPPSPELNSQREEDVNKREYNTPNDKGINKTGRISFATAVKLKTTAAMAAAMARRGVAAANAMPGGSETSVAVATSAGGGAWGLFQAAGVDPRKGDLKHRRASLPCSFAPEAATLGIGGELSTLRPQQQQQQQQRRRLHGIDEHRVSGGGGRVAEVGWVGDDHNGGMLETAAEMEAELIRLRKLTFVSEKKLSAEVSIRMNLEQRNREMQEELKKLRLSKETSEIQLREEAKRQWSEGRKVKARCASLERLLVEAYELINMVELQHHLQVKSLMPDLYGDPRRRSGAEAAGEQRQNNNDKGGICPQHQERDLEPVQHHHQAGRGDGHLRGLGLDRGRKSHTRVADLGKPSVPVTRTATASPAATEQRVHDTIGGPKFGDEEMMRRANALAGGGLLVAV